LDASTIQSYIKVADLVDLILKSDPNAFYRGRVMEIGLETIVIGSRRYTDYDVDDSKTLRLTSIIDLMDVSIIRKIEDAD
jgi:hypothetical protein